MWSPVALTEEAEAHLAAIGGPVSHIVIPAVSPEHSIFAPSFLDRWPSATVWIVEELLHFPIKAPGFDQAVLVCVLTLGSLR